MRQFVGAYAAFVTYYRGVNPLLRLGSDILSQKSSKNDRVLHRWQNDAWKTVAWAFSVDATVGGVLDHRSHLQIKNISPPL